jgi:hypothetical protein
MRKTISFDPFSGHQMRYGEKNHRGMYLWCNMK